MVSRVIALLRHVIVTTGVQDAVRPASVVWEARAKQALMTAGHRVPVTPLQEAMEDPLEVRVRKTIVTNTGVARAC